MLYVCAYRLYGYTYINQSIHQSTNPLHRWAMKASEAPTQLWQEGAVDTKSVTNMIHTQVRYLGIQVEFSQMQVEFLKMHKLYTFFYLHP